MALPPKAGNAPCPRRMLMRLFPTPSKNVLRRIIVTTSLFVTPIIFTACGGNAHRTRRNRGGSGAASWDTWGGVSLRGGNEQGKMRGYVAGAKDAGPTSAGGRRIRPSQLPHAL